LKILIQSPCSASTIIKYGMKKWPIWECEPSTFPWKYEEKETCLILKGEAIIRMKENESYIIKAGDLVVFPKGLSCTWTVVKFMQKHYRYGD